MSHITNDSSLKTLFYRKPLLVKHCPYAKLVLVLLSLKVVNRKYKIPTFFFENSVSVKTI